MRLTLLLLCLALPLSALAQSEADRAAIDAVYARFSEAYAQHDPNMVADLYLDDARYLPGSSDTPILEGRDTIRSQFQFLSGARERGTAFDISFRFVDRGIDGDLAYDIGYYKLVATPAEGEPRTSVGKFVTVLRQSDDGRWRFVVDGYSGAPTEAFEE
jgi:uncharacterized protein (TIGR02246 family)